MDWQGACSPRHHHQDGDYHDDDQGRRGRSAGIADQRRGQPLTPPDPEDLPRLDAFVPGPPIERAPTKRGQLDGLNFAVKDLIDVEGTVTGGGNPDWATTHEPAIATAPVVAALMQAGAHLAGKTVSDELAFSLEGANHHYGTPLNPRAPDRLPGGSSSGSASAVAGGAVDFALGTDTGGSVRVPAAFCGLIGFRPTHGALSLVGVVPFAPSYDTVGVFARDLTMIDRIADVLIPTAIGSANRRVLIAEDAFALADRSVALALRDAFPDVLRAGHSIQVFDGAASDWYEAYRVLQGWEIWQALGPWITQTNPRFGAAIAARFADAAAITAAQAEHWRLWRDRMRLHLTDMMGADGVLILPTASTVAPLKNAPPAEIGAFYQATLALTAVAGHTGSPAVSLPTATVDGLPVGLSLVSPPGTDRALLAFCRRV